MTRTFPDPLDQMMWVRIGSQDWPTDAYGAQGKPVDRSVVMPAHPELSDQELAQVVLYERRVLAREDPPASPEEDVLLKIAQGQITFADAGLGELSEAAGVPESRLGSGRDRHPGQPR